MIVKLVGIKGKHLTEAECGNCKHWEEARSSSPGDICYCTAVKARDRDHMEYIRAQIVTEDPPGSNVLATSKYFGCMLWEPGR